jgi:hypothetical protein
MERDIEMFRKRSVLAVCAAGTDRSHYISEELNKRGYFASSAGVLKNHNYVTEQDLANIGIVVFASANEKNIFDREGRLKKVVNKNGISMRVISVTESDKNRAHDSGKIEELKQKIREQLDCIGLIDLNS